MTVERNTEQEMLQGPDMEPPYPCEKCATIFCLFLTGLQKKCCVFPWVRETAEDMLDLHCFTFINLIMYMCVWPT